MQDQLVQADIQGYVPSGKNTIFFLSKTIQKDLEETDDKEPITMARFLPYEDALLKAYKSTRNRFYGVETHLVESKGGEAKPTVWLDGSVVGCWGWSNKKNSDMIVYLKDLDEKIVGKLRPEAELVQRFIDARKIVWKKIAEEDDVLEEMSEKEEKEDKKPKSKKKPNKSQKEKKTKKRKSSENTQEPRKKRKV